MYSGGNNLYMVARKIKGVGLQYFAAAGGEHRLVEDEKRAVAAKLRGNAGQRD